MHSVSYLLLFRLLLEFCAAELGWVVGVLEFLHDAVRVVLHYYHAETQGKTMVVFYIVLWKELEVQITLLQQQVLTFSIVSISPRKFNDRSRDLLL